MFHDKVTKYIASVVVVSYFFVSNTTCVLAADVQQVQIVIPDSQLFNSMPDAGVLERANELQDSYREEINTLMRESNYARGIGRALLTTGVVALVGGASALYIGENTVSDAIEKIPGDDPAFQHEKDNALQSLQSLGSLKGVGRGILVLGGIGLIGYYIGTNRASTKRDEMEARRAELETRLKDMDIPSEYYQSPEPKAAVLRKIDDLKKRAITARAIQTFFSRLTVGCIISAGLLFVTSDLNRDVVTTITIDDSNTEQVVARNAALDKADTLQKAGFGLLGAAVLSGLAFHLSGKRARATDNQVEELESTLLRFAERLEMCPKPNGFLVMYTHSF